MHALGKSLIHQPEVHIRKEPSFLLEGFQSLANASQMGGNGIRVEADIIQVCRGADTKQRFMANWNWRNAGTGSLNQTLSQ
jgi:hypothetical protein